MQWFFKSSNKTDSANISMIVLVEGAIQIIRDTLEGGGVETVSPNDTRGRPEGGGYPKCHVGLK